MKKEIRSVLISRTDGIGDVVLTLPLAHLIKDLLGDVRVMFFGNTYTYPVISLCDAVDGFVNYDTFSGFDDAGRVSFLKDLNVDAIIHVFPRKEIATAAKAAGIKTRIGTSHRFYHWTTCNRLINLGRKNSSLHEAQLNTRLLKPLGYAGQISLDEVPALYRLQKIEPLPKKYSMLLANDKFRLIIHPKSKASAREWKLDHYRDLIRFLPADRYQIIITGSEKEAADIGPWSETLPPHAISLCGLLSLEELISLINASDGLVAASTGPLHIAAALGKHVLGIYPPIRPMHPGRWAPVGKGAEFLVVNKSCSACRSNAASCTCINDIMPSSAEQIIRKWRK